MMVGVLLAAGASTRMGSPKALAKTGKKTGQESYIAHGVRNLWCACDTVVVVLGANAKLIRKRTEDEFVRLVETGCFDQELHAAHRHKAQKLEVRFVVNRTWKKGMYSSARVGLEAALKYAPAGVFVLPVDHPSVRAATVLDLGTVMAQAIHAAHSPVRKPAARRTAFSYALVPRLRGRRGHPIVLTSALARAIVKDKGAEDLSDAVRRSARLVGYLDVRDAGITRNVNRPGD
jgi:CTP:molybdopterin cytidylyltransferase MocA